LGLFGKEWKVWTLQGIIYFAASGLVLIPGLAMMVSAIVTGINNPAASGSSAPPEFYQFLTGLGFFYGGACASSFLHVFLLAGMFRTARKQLHGQPIAFSDIFGAGDVYLPLLGAYLLENLAHGLIAQVCPLGNLAFAGLWVFLHPLIVEGKMGVFEAFSTSWNVAKQNFMFYIGLVLVMGLVSISGYLVGCGAVVTLPIATIMLVVAYRDTFERSNAYGVAAPPATPMTPPVYYGPAGAPVAGGTCPACGRLVAAGAVLCPSCGRELPGSPGPWSAPR